MKNFKMVFVAFLVATITLFSGCYDGFLKSKEYNKTLSGIRCYDTDENTYFFDNKILINNIQFDNQIGCKKYCKFEVDFMRDCEVCGMVFIIKPNTDFKANFIVLNNEKQLLNTSKSMIANITNEIGLFFEQTRFYEGSQLSIKLEQIQFTNNEKTAFQIDGFTVVFGE